MSSGSQVSKAAPMKYIRIYTVIPFSFPFSQKVLKFRIENKMITAAFVTEKREDIIRSMFPMIVPRIRTTATAINVSGYERVYDAWSWMTPDRFGQLNFMKTEFYIDLGEEKIEDLYANENRIKYLSICADVINKISTSYRILTGAYYPRNYTEDDFMAYSISYSSDGRTFSKGLTCTGSNVTLTNFYPDDSLHFDINDIISDFVTSMPLHTALMTNAEDFFRDKNYRIAVIEADTVVEILISKILLKYYNEKLKINDPIFKETFIKELEENRVDKNVPYLKIVSSNLVGSREWSNWKQKCHQIRNSVIHQSKILTKGEAEDALSAASELIELLKNHLYDENDWLIEGKAFSGNKKMAIRYLSNAIAKNPSNPDAYFHLGNLHLQNREFKLAKESYGKSLSLRQSAGCYYKLGIIQEAQGQVDEATKDYDRAINLKYEVNHPHNNPYYRKIMILIIKEQFQLDEIIDALLFLFKTFPNYSEFPYHLITAYGRKNDDNNAMKYLNILIDLSPNVQMFHLQRAYHELKLGEKSKALDDLEKTIILDDSLKKSISEDPHFVSLHNEERWKTIFK